MILPRWYKLLFKWNNYFKPVYINHPYLAFRENFGSNYVYMLIKIYKTSLGYIVYSTINF